MIEGYFWIFFNSYSGKWKVVFFVYFYVLVIFNFSSLSSRREFYEVLICDD